jgi:hypothetical protein
VCPDPPISNWKPCDDTFCPVPPDYDLPACQKGPCPNPPDKRVKKCKGKVPFCKPGDPVTDQCIEKPPEPPKPIRGEVLNANASGGKTTITINRGTTQGIDRGWRGRLLTPAGKVFPSSDFVVKSVGTKTATAEVNLTTDQVDANKTVELLPP